MSDTTSTAKHTPGPWKAEKYCIWANNHNGSVYIAGTQTGIDTDQQKANARLIAAAPDLLRALEIIQGWSACQCREKHGDNPNCCVLVAEKAIARAKGEA